jgi:hypothetical protein
MGKINFMAFRGVVTDIEDFMMGDPNEAGCDKLISVTDESGSIVRFVVSPDTYVVGQEMIIEGDLVTGYYDGDAPVILIYPPQYPAIVMVKENPHRHVKVDFFDSDLISSDGQLMLTLTPSVPIVLTNGQAFSGIPANRNLIIIYGPTTKSIPAQTVPYQVIVLC